MAIGGRRVDMAENGTTAAILRAIRAFWKDQGYGPSYRDIMRATGVSSTSVVSYHILRLERAGALRRTAGVARSYRVIDGKEADVLYQAIELPSEEPVQFVGVYILRWGKASEPTMGFTPIDEDTLVEFAKLCREYPNEPVMNLLEQVMGAEAGAV